MTQLQLEGCKLPPRDTQCWTLLQALALKGEKLTVLTALQKYGVYALSQRAGELERTYNWPIKREWLDLPSGKRVRVYSL